MAKKLNVEELVLALRDYKVWVPETSGSWGGYEKAPWAQDLANMIEECATEEPGCDCTEET